MKQTSAGNASDEPLSEASNLANLKRRSVRGGAVVMGSQCVSVGVQLASTVILARLLLPEDFGMLAMVTAVTAFAGIFRDLGLSSAAIQKKQLSRSEQSNLFWLNLLLGAALTLAVALSAPLISWLYAKPALEPITAALSVTFLISSAGAQHSARLTRDMQFLRKSLATLSGSLIGLGTSVAFALEGHSYWSLVWGNLAGVSSTTLFLAMLSSFRPQLPSRKANIRSLVAFGGRVTCFEMINYFQRNLDNILIGRFWGSEALGLYSRAYALLMFPIANIRRPISSVAYPVLSKLQDQPQAFRSYYLKTSQVLAFASMPVTAFLFANSETVVEVALGEQWSGSASLFSLLAIAAFTQPVTGLTGSLLLSLGESGRYLRCGAFNAIVLCICIAIGARWGSHGVAAAYAIGNYVILYPWLRWALKDTPVSLRDLASACWFPAVASISAAAALMIVRQCWPLDSRAAALVAANGAFLVTLLGAAALNRDCRQVFEGFKAKAGRLTLQGFSKA